VNLLCHGTMAADKFPRLHWRMYVSLLGDMVWGVADAGGRGGGASVKWAGCRGEHGHQLSPLPDH